MKYKFTSGETNVAKRPDIRKKISDQKWKGFTFTCKTCGVVKRVMPSKLKEKKFCSRACCNKYMSTALRGENALHWKGGKTRDEGYVAVHTPDHPNARQTGYVAEHRLVMEEHLGHIISKEYDVHHINHIRDDNRIENLMVLTHSEHLKLHYKTRRISDDGKLLPNAVEQLKRNM